MSETTILGALAAHAAARPDDVALVAEDASLDWSALRDAVLSFAGALDAGGVAVGDRVAIIAGNSAAAVTAYLGAVAAGATAVPMPVSATPDVLARMLADCAPAATVTDTAGRGLVKQPTGVGFSVDGAAGPWQEPDADPLPAARDVTGDTGFNIIYSSGTTGLPKGILHDHAMRNAQAARGLFAIGASSKMLLSTPLYSNATLMPLLSTIFHGGRVNMMRRFDTARWLEIAERERITHTMLVPVQYRRILLHEDFARRNLSAFEVKQSTGASLDTTLKERIIDEWPGRFLEVYGQTEGGPTAILEAAEHPDKLHTVGRPAEGVTIRIVDENGRDVAQGETGEIVGRSSLMMQGYWRRPDADAEIRWIGPDGHLYHKPGDLGAFDEDGFLVIKGRSKDVIISGGVNVYPADLEAVLCAHDAVAEAAVIGVPSEDWGETPLAIVTLRDGHEAGSDDLRDWANARVGKTQRLSRVSVRESLPRSSVGKVLKAELRAPFWPDA